MLSSEPRQILICFFRLLKSLTFLFLWNLNYLYAFLLGIFRWGSHIRWRVIPLMLLFHTYNLVLKTFRRIWMIVTFVLIPLLFHISLRCELRRWNYLIAVKSTRGTQIRNYSAYSTGFHLFYFHRTFLSKLGKNVSMNTIILFVHWYLLM